MRLAVRFAIVVACIVALVGLGVHYGATYDENWPHPTGDQLADEPAGWDGERVLLFGTVETVAEDRFTMRIETDAGEGARVVEVRGTSTDAEPDGVVQVYGELAERGTVQHADRVVVVVASPDLQLSKYGISLVGLVVLIGTFLRYWRLDVRRLAITPRGDRDG